MRTRLLQEEPSRLDWLILSLCVRVRVRVHDGHELSAAGLIGRVFLFDSIQLDADDSQRERILHHPS